MKIYAPIIIFLVFNSLYAQSNSVDSILLASYTTKDTTVADELYRLSKQYYKIDKDSAFILAKRSAELSERIDFTKGRMSAYRMLSAIGVRVGKLESSLQYIEKGLELIEREQLPIEEKVNLLINKGNAYLYAYDLKNATEAYILANKISRENKLYKKAGSILNNIGVLYRKMENYDMAIKTYKDGIILRTEIKDTLGIANTFYNLGATYAKIDSSVSAYKSINKAKELFNLLNMSNEVKECNLSLGTAAFDLEDFDEAFDFLNPLEKDKTFQIGMDDNFRLHIILAELAIKRLDNNEAKRLIEEIEEIEESEFVEEKITYLRVRSQVYELLKQYDKALSYRDRYQEELATFNNLETIKIREEMLERFQSTIKDLEIQKLESNQTLTYAKLKVAKQRIFGLIIGLLILVAFLFFLFKFNKKIQNKNLIITRANQDKEILLKEIHHRVKNNLQVVTSLLSMQERKVIDKDTKDALKSSKTRVQSMSILHQNLYQGENLKEIGVQKYISQLIRNIQNTYNVEDDIEFHQEIDPIEMDVDTLIPIGLIVNELITNSIKHAFPNKTDGEIGVSLRGSQNFVTLIVKDNGVGLPSTELPSKDGSLGTRLINSFAKRLDGKIRVDNSKGTKVSITFEKVKLAIEV